MAYLPEVNISDYTEADKQLRAMRQKNLLQRAVQSNLDERGQINESGFYRDAARYGLDPEAIHTGMNLNAAQQEEAVNALMRQTRAKGLGGDIRTGERNQAPYGTPPSVTVKNPEYQDPTASDWMKDVPPGGSIPSTETATVEQAKPFAKSEGVRNFFMSMGLGRNVRPAQETIAKQEQAPVPERAFAPVPEQTQSPAPGVDGTYSGLPQASRMQDVDMNQYRPTIQVPGPDQRSFNQQVADSLDPSKSVFGTSTDGVRGEVTDSGLFDWKPVDTGTNEFTQFNTALNTQLGSLGYKDAPSYLKSVYDQTLLANTPREPNAALQMQGVEGMAKYQGEVSDYNAGLAKAQGLAQTAVNAERAKLTDMAKQYGVNVIENRKTELGGGKILRDPAKRTEAQALVTNEKNIEYANEAVRNAGTNTSKLMLAFPQVARAYATALNPGMQLNEGNLKEVAANMFPENVGNKEFIAKIASGLARGFVKNDWSVFDQFGDALEAQAPGALAARMQKLASEAKTLNAKSLQGYVTSRPNHEIEKEAPAPTVEPTQAPTPQPSSVPSIPPVPMSASDIDELEAYHDTRYKLAQKLGLPAFNRREQEQFAPRPNVPGKARVSKPSSAGKAGSVEMPSWLKALVKK